MLPLHLTIISIIYLIIWFYECHQSCTTACDHIIWASLLFFAIIQSDYDYLTFPGLTDECVITVHFREQQLATLTPMRFNRQTLYGTFVLTISNYMIIMIIIVLIMIFIIMANGNRLPACMWSTGSQDRKLCSHLEWPNVPTYLYKINSNI